MALDHIHVGVRSERSHTPYVSSIVVEWKVASGSTHTINLTRNEAVETCARILAMVSLLPPMDASEIEEMLNRV